MHTKGIKRRTTLKFVLVLASTLDWMNGKLQDPFYSKGKSLRFPFDGRLVGFSHYRDVLDKTEISAPDENWTLALRPDGVN
jgi:hypothetical protein